MRQSAHFTEINNFGRCFQYKFVRNSERVATFGRDFLYKWKPDEKSDIQGRFPVMRVAYAFLMQFTDLYSFLDVVLAIPLRVPRSRKPIAPGASLNDTLPLQN